MPIRVDRSSPVPLYFQVAQHLEQMIESGELPMGTRLDNETDLAGQLGLSKPTMRRAIEYLVGRGLLVRRRGIGTQVVQAKVTREVELTSLYDDLAKTGRDPSTTVVSFGTEPASDSLAATLGIPAGTPVYVFERLRYADAEPLALMRNHVPGQLIRLSAADLQSRGCTTCSGRTASACGSPSRPSGRGPRPRPRPARWARSKGAPLLTMERSAYDEQGRAVEHGQPPLPGVAVQLRPHPDRLVTQVTRLRRAGDLGHSGSG